MKGADLRQMSDKDLYTALDNEKRAFMNLRFRNASSELQNTAQIRSTKRSIARIMTVIAEKKAQGRFLIKG